MGDFFRWNTKDVEEFNKKALKQYYKSYKNEVDVQIDAGVDITTVDPIVVEKDNAIILEHNVFNLDENENTEFTTSNTQPAVNTDGGIVQIPTNIVNAALNQQEDKIPTGE